MLGVSHMLAGLNGLLAKIGSLTYKSPVYNYTLIGKVPKRLLGTPPEVVPGDASVGQAIMSGSIVIDGSKRPPMSLKGLPDIMKDNWLEYVHGFLWLGDLRCVGTIDARRFAQSLFSEWLNVYQNWEENSWKPEIVGTRLVNWLTHFVFLTDGDNQLTRERIFVELGRQSLHLSRTFNRCKPSWTKVSALKGLIYAGVALPDSDQYLLEGLDCLEKEMKHQIYPDGGHISRNPEIQMKILKDLLDVRETLLAANIDLPTWLLDTFKNMVPMLRALRQGDGSLCLFHGGGLGDPKKIDTLLSKIKIKGKPLLAASYTGYQRLESGKTVLIVDVGLNPGETKNEWGHNGALSFEMSVGKERMIVNCGSSRQLGEEWHKSLRGAAAHSTAIIGEYNDQFPIRAMGNSSAANMIKSSRREFQGNIVLDSINDEYQQLLEIRHRRIIMLSENGCEIFGEDQFTGGSETKFCLRFHLHPNVQATLLQQSGAVLLKPRRGSGWKFSTIESDLSLEGSVYIENPGRIRRTNQIVIYGRLTGDENIVKWNLREI